MHLELITLLGIKRDEQIYELIASTAAGEIAVFPGHEPLVTLAVPGMVAIRHNKGDSDEKLEYFAISGGIIEITKDKIRVLVDEADHSEDITENEAKEALERAMKLRESAKSQVEIDKAEQIIGRQQAKLNVAGLRRRHRR